MGAPCFCEVPAHICRGIPGTQKRNAGNARKSAGMMGKGTESDSVSMGTPRDFAENRSCLAEHRPNTVGNAKNSAAEYFYSATKFGKSAAEFPGSAALSGGSPVVSLDFGLQWPDSPHCSVCTATQTADNRHVAHAPLPVIPRAARLVNLFTAGLLAHPYRNAPSRCPQSPSMGLRMAKPPAEVLAHSVARGIPCPVHCSEKRIHSYGYSRSLALRSLLAPAPCP